MAAGEHAGADGRAWIAAAAVAYEVQCRLCDAASIRARGWDHTTYGSLSSALAAAQAAGPRRTTQTVHALGIAGTTGTALRLTRAGELSMWKGCAFAHAARNGVFAALLAREGMTGPAPLFEGDMGFCQQVSGPVRARRSSAGPPAGDWMLPKTSIKFVPAEYHSQSAIAAAFELRAPDRRPVADPLDRDRHLPDGRRDHRPGPREVAAQDPRDGRPQPPLLHGRRPRRRRRLGRPVHPRAAHRPRPARPRRPDDRRRGPRADRRLSRRHPQPGPGDARRRHGRSSREVAFPPGHDKNPLTDDQLAGKFHGLADPVLGPDRAEELWDRLSRLESDPRPHEALAAAESVLSRMTQVGKRVYEM